MTNEKAGIVDEVHTTMYKGQVVKGEQQLRKAANIKSCNCAAMELGIRSGVKRHKQSLNYDISSNYAYTIVNMNRYNVHDICNLPSKVTEPHIDKEGEYFSAESDKDEDVLSENSTREDMNDQQFVVTLSPEEWSRMKPEERMYKCVDKDKPNRRNRAYYIIPPNSYWTDTINEHFWDITSLSCALSFKRANVYKSGTPFLIIFGRCKSCSSIISGSLHQEPNENRHILINFKYRGPFVDCSTGNERILKRTRRRLTLEELVEKNISACTVRREEARRSMHLGDNEPSHIPALNALRLAKSRELKSRHVDNDPILALGKLKYLTEYYIASDATGGITAKLKRPFGNVSGVVYLYSVTVRDHEAGVQYTVANMLSESHNNLRIHHFLESLLWSGAPVPKEAVYHSVALLSGLVKTSLNLPPFQTLSETEGTSASTEEITQCEKANTTTSQVIQNAVSFDISQNTTREGGSEVIGNNKLNNSKYKTGIISAHNPKSLHVPEVIFILVHTPALSVTLQFMQHSVSAQSRMTGRKKDMLNTEHHHIWNIQRAEVLRPICESSILSTNLTRVNSTSTAKAMASRLLADFPSVTETFKCTNTKCVTRNSILRPVIYIAIEIQSLNNLEACIHQFLAEEKMQCSENCDGLKAIVSTSSNQHLLTEVVNSSIVSNPADIAYPFEVPLKMSQEK
ncbi:hypothetical protein PR048_009214 [Dryococelus australis]|uniref:Uncharacterized protein n=1 Tax=Dryococelus australis TaxID=614101 RepID=A0ABQ9HZB3_9NEOP|nr:hypothetical protein PR048_009214 [Dryococelus australis]